MQKVIKDSVHGYLTVEEQFVNIINSAEFQRLKFIEQGSFRVLFPAARHDRFIHSLGVYYLATKISKYFIQNIKTDLALENEIDWGKIQKYANSFHYASLLHDVGHAPFSHTTEEFFAENIDKGSGQRKIDKDLITVVCSYIDSLNMNEAESESRKERFRVECLCKANSHEIISATILVNKADDFLGNKKDDFDLELAARAVIGATYKYDNITDKNELEDLGIKNCFIRLLNSKTVDVDKLDYIKRDTFMTGFDNATVDLERIAKSVTAIKKDDNIYPAFKKSAISVIDNVFRAKEEQGNWIIAHPVVSYESELLIRVIKNLWSSSKLKKVFSIESLQKSSKSEYCLLNDSDILVQLKKKVNFADSTLLFNEVFDRSLRAKPIWKSKTEYNVFFDYNKDVFLFFKPLCDSLKKSYFVLNDSTYNTIQTSNKESEATKKAAKLLFDFHINNMKETLSFVLITPKTSFVPQFNPDEVFIYLGNNLIQGNNFISYREFKCETKVHVDKEKNIDKEITQYFYLYTKEHLNCEQLNNLKAMIFDAVKKAPVRA